MKIEIPKYYELKMTTETHILEIDETEIINSIQDFDNLLVSIANDTRQIIDEKFIKNIICLIKQHIKNVINEDDVDDEFVFKLEKDIFNYKIDNEIVEEYLSNSNNSSFIETFNFLSYDYRGHIDYTRCLSLIKNISKNVPFLEIDNYRKTLAKITKTTGRIERHNSLFIFKNYKDIIDFLFCKLYELTKDKRDKRKEYLKNYYETHKVTKPKNILTEKEKEEKKAKRKQYVKDYNKKYYENNKEVVEKIKLTKEQLQEKILAEKEKKKLYQKSYYEKKKQMISELFNEDLNSNNSN